LLHLPDYYMQLDYDHQKRTRHSDGSPISFPQDMICFWLGRNSQVYDFERHSCLGSRKPSISAHVGCYSITTYRVNIRAFRTSESESESESADFSEVRVRKFRTLKTLRTRTQRVCLFTHLYCKEVNISQKKSEISIFSFLKSYYSL
jgi:hypothetical protein